MNIQILHLIEGARQATGLTVIIDVFRAFTVEAYLMRNHAEKIIPVGDVETAFAYKAKHPDTTVLCGERAGIIIDGFDYGNSPSQLDQVDLTGKTVVHTTSAGTQGIANAIHADEIIGGSLVCARAIAEYIKRSNPETVSLVCMGLHGKKRTDEDTLCAEYIKALVEGKPFSQLKQRIDRLKETDGAKFFDPERQSVFPEPDFHLSVQTNVFPFVLRLKQDPDGGLAYMERIDDDDLAQALSRLTLEQVLGLPVDTKGRLAYGSYQPPEGSFDCALVLGGPPHFMESRAKAAAELYLAGRVPYLMVSGGVAWDSPMGHLTEAQQLIRYLEQAGVPTDRILVEDQSTNTATNMKYCRVLLEEMFPGKALHLAIATSAFHVRRAVALAEHFLSEHTVMGVSAVYPKDAPEAYAEDADLCQRIDTECRCLWNLTTLGYIPDIPVL